MNMFVKTLALPFLVAPIFVSCMVDGPEDKFDFSSDGQPIANYQIMGKVSGEDGKPINGIRVIADYSTDVIYRADTLYTDQEGEYSKFMSIPRVAEIRICHSGSHRDLKRPFRRLLCHLVQRHAQKEMM